MTLIWYLMLWKLKQGIILYCMTLIQIANTIQIEDIQDRMERMDVQYLTELITVYMDDKHLTNHFSYSKTSIIIIRLTSESLHHLLSPLKQLQYSTRHTTYATHPADSLSKRQGVTNGVRRHTVADPPNIHSPTVTYIMSKSREVDLTTKLQTNHHKYVRALNVF